MVLVHSLNEVLLNSIQLLSSYSPDKKTVTKGNDYVVSLNRVMVLVHWISSHCALPVYEVLKLFSGQEKSKEGQ